MSGFKQGDRVRHAKLGGGTLAPQPPHVSWWTVRFDDGEFFYVIEQNLTLVPPPLKLGDFVRTATNDIGVVTSRAVGEYRVAYFPTAITMLISSWWPLDKLTPITQAEAQKELKSAGN